MTESKPKPNCPDCNGSGVISRPYLVPGLHSMTACKS